MGDFKKLLVWQKAHELSMDTHHAAGRIRGALHLSLRSQMVRAAQSIPSNIVEGRGTQTDREFAKYIRSAISSSDELEYHLLSARDQGVMKCAMHDALLERVVEVRKMLYGLLDRLNET
jgi:four helix bundle protein